MLNVFIGYGKQLLRFGSIVVGGDETVENNFEKKIGAFDIGGVETDLKQF